MHALPPARPSLVELLEDLAHDAVRVARERRAERYAPRRTDLCGRKADGVPDPMVCGYHVAMPDWRERTWFG